MRRAGGKTAIGKSLAGLVLCLFLAAAAGPVAASGGSEPAAHGASAEQTAPAEHGAPAGEHGAAAGEHGGGHGAGQMKDFMWRWIDFGVMAAIVVWALKKADMKGALVRRRENVAALLREAVDAREAAEKKLAEYTRKLEKANAEVDEISAAIRREGELEKERIVAEAKATAAKITEQAQRAADQEVQKARAELRAEAARLAVELAEKKIRDNIGKNDQDKLVNDYLSKVVELQ